MKVETVVKENDLMSSIEKIKKSIVGIESSLKLITNSDKNNLTHFKAE
jgi:hypothetical protein